MKLYDISVLKEGDKCYLLPKELNDLKTHLDGHTYHYKSYGNREEIFILVLETNENVDTILGQLNMVQKLKGKPANFVADLEEHRTIDDLFIRYGCR